jgi:hypothetical protein
VEDRMNIEDITNGMKYGLVDYFEDVWFEKVEINDNKINIKIKYADDTTQEFTVTVVEVKNA